MATPVANPEDLVWGLVDVAGGVKSRCVLQDALFLAQERGLLPGVFHFPVWPGIGTSRYSEDLEQALASLLRSGKVFDTGGPSTLKALEDAPGAAKKAVAEVARLLATHDEPTLSLMAAYAMAQRGARERGVRNTARLRDAAAIRLGWPKDIVAVAERELAAIGKA